MQLSNNTEGYEHFKGLKAENNKIVTVRIVIAHEIQILGNRDIDDHFFSNAAQAIAPVIDSNFVLQNSSLFKLALASDGEFFDRSEGLLFRLVSISAEPEGHPDIIAVENAN